MQKVFKQKQTNKQTNSPPTTWLHGLRVGPQTNVLFRFALTVFGFGVNGAVLRAVFRNQHRTEQIWTAFELGTNTAAEIRYLVRCSDDLGHGPVCFASIPRNKEEKVMERPHTYSDLFCTVDSKAAHSLSKNKAGCVWFLCHVFSLFLMSSQKYF